MAAHRWKATQESDEEQRSRFVYPTTTTLRRGEAGFGELDSTSSSDAPMSLPSHPLPDRCHGHPPVFLREAVIGFSTAAPAVTICPKDKAYPLVVVMPLPDLAGLNAEKRFRNADGLGICRVTRAYQGRFKMFKVLQPLCSPKTQHPYSAFPRQDGPNWRPIEPVALDDKKSPAFVTVPLRGTPDERCRTAGCRAPVGRHPIRHYVHPCAQALAAARLKPGGRRGNQGRGCGAYRNRRCPAKEAHWWKSA